MFSFCSSGSALLLYASFYFNLSGHFDLRFPISDSQRRAKTMLTGNQFEPSERIIPCNTTCRQKSMPSVACGAGRMIHHAGRYIYPASSCKAVAEWIDAIPLPSNCPKQTTNNNTPEKIGLHHIIVVEVHPRILVLLFSSHTARAPPCLQTRVYRSYLFPRPRGVGFKYGNLSLLPSSWRVKASAGTPNVIPCALNPRTAAVGFRLGFWFEGENRKKEGASSL